MSAKQPKPKWRPAIIVLAILAVSVALSAFQSVEELRSRALEVETAYIPAQCYTVTLDDDGTVNNTCYVCHSGSITPNRTFDHDLQLEYAFPSSADANPWTNTLEDRSERIAAISDGEILRYIRDDNYFDSSGRVDLAGRLANLPASWDYDGDEDWDGFVPDCYFNFDELGFDRTPSGDYTWWRAYAYYPVPTTHWPSGGAPNDSMIRLPEPFRQNNAGREDIDTYIVNLAIVESLLKRADVSIRPVNEETWNVDLDGDGSIGTADHIAFDDRHGRTMSYVGRAGRELERGRLHLAAGLFPEGTQFLSTVRYVDPQDDGTTELSPRMKEVRLLEKTGWLTYAELEVLGIDEIKETEDFPDRVNLPFGDPERGLSNQRGWRAYGFIEDAAGELRPQTTEELFNCIGCHGGLGATADSIFSYRRKLSAQEYQGGWFHWDQRNLAGINEPKIEYRPGRVQYEYTFYLMYTGGGDEYRANPEIRERFIDPYGYLKSEMASRLHEDIGLLLYPSRERALELNKSYLTIVQDQDYVFGRDALIASEAEIHDVISEDEVATGVETPIRMVGSTFDFQNGEMAVPDLPPVSDEFKAAVEGVSYPGAFQTGYEMDHDGMYWLSDYGLDNDRVAAHAPVAITYPARIIGTCDGIDWCYDCHRLPAPAIPGQSKVSVEMDFPATSMTEPGLDMTRLTDGDGTDVGPVWSPDDSRIAWSSDRTGEWQVWVMDADGSNQRQLTFGPTVNGWPIWSPDSERIVYWGYDPDTERSYVETVSADGGDVVRVQETDGKTDRPAYDPTGEYIAYSMEDERNWDIWVSSADGKEHHRLTTSPDMECNPLWRPSDGEKIAFIVVPQVSVYPEDVPGMDSTEMSYGKVWESFIDVSDGFENPRIERLPGIQSVEVTDWSADGRHVAYVVTGLSNASGEDRYIYKVYTEDVYSQGEHQPGGEPKYIPQSNTLDDRAPFFNPAGDEIVFWAWDKNYRATLWTANIDGSDLRQLTTYGHDMHARWAPDGEQIVFESSRAGTIDIWTLRMD